MLFFITICVAFIGITIFYRLWGRAGLLAWIALSGVLANIETIKCVDIFGLNTCLGTVLYSSTFLCTDILSQFYGGKEARKGVLIGFVTLIATLILSQVCLQFQANENDFGGAEALAVIFGFLPRVTLASVGTFLISNTLDTYLYDWIGKRTDKIWVRNNFSTMTSQLLDTILFAWAAFGGTMPAIGVWEIALTTYLFKVVIAACDTPFMYIARKIHAKRFEGKTVAE